MNNKNTVKPQSTPTPFQKAFGVQPVHEKPSSSSGQKNNSNGNKK